MTNSSSTDKINSESSSEYTENTGNSQGTYSKQLINLFLNEDFIAEFKQLVNTKIETSPSEIAASLEQTHRGKNADLTILPSQNAYDLFHKVGLALQNQQTVEGYWGYILRNNIDGFSKYGLENLEIADLGLMKMMVDIDLASRIAGAQTETERASLIQEARKLNNEQGIVNIASQLDLSSSGKWHTSTDTNPDTKTDVDKSALIKKRRGITVRRNGRVGRAYERIRLAELLELTYDLQEQVTVVIQADNGLVRARLDAIAFDKITGKLIIEEYKASATAPFTENQKKVFDLIKKHGATVISENTGAFYKGYKIAPGTEVHTLRPGDIRDYIGV